MEIRHRETGEIILETTGSALAVPLDVGRWALIRGATPHLRRRVAADLRALSRGPTGALTVRLARALGALKCLERTSTLTFAGGFTA